MLSQTSISDFGQHISNWITYSHFSLLPTRFGNTRNLAFTCQFAEADPAHIELAHIATGSAANSAAIDVSGTELGLPIGLYDH
ncbi:hypothetical protein SDC9_66819 [bioreactor metagenome]|uniref:Uncharacterized protein n=1 Tax=bioreactor metagenome TaxID=1076179 RepID=A0A644XWB4_9ZZZZ